MLGAFACNSRSNRRSDRAVSAFMHRPFFAPIAVLALALIPATAVAEGCLDRVRELARSQNISTDPPTASPDKAPGAPGQSTGPGVTSRDLGRSGGVIEPPATSDRSVVTPPATTDSRMPTMPDVTPKPFE